MADGNDSSSSEDRLVIVTDEEIEPDDVTSNVISSMRPDGKLRCARDERERAVERGESSRQSTSRACPNENRRRNQRPARQTPYDRPNRSNRSTEATTLTSILSGPTVTFPTLSYSSLPYATQIMPSLTFSPIAMPPLQPAQPAQHHTIHRNLNPFYTHSPQISVRSPSQLFAPRAAPQFSPSTTSMVFFSGSLPHLVPMAPRTPTPTTAPWLERQFPSLLQIPQPFPVSVPQAEPVPSYHPTPRTTHTVTSGTTNVIYSPATLLPVLYPREESDQPDLRINQTAPHRPRTPVDIVLEHQQYQYWPVDSFEGTVLVEEEEVEVDLLDTDLWLDVPLPTPSSPSPVTSPLSIDPSTAQTTSVTTTTTCTLTTTTSEVRTLLGKK